MSLRRKIDDDRQPDNGPDLEQGAYSWNLGEIEALRGV